MTAESIVEGVAREAGCNTTIAQEVMTAGLRALHRHAFCEAEGVSGALLECFANFGGHLGGHLKTGHSWTGQNRPPRVGSETGGCEYSPPFPLG